MADQLILQTIIFLASTAYQISQQNKMKREADKRKGFNLTISGQAVSVPVAYGKNALGGIEVKHQVNNSYTSATNNASKTFSENFPNTSKSGSKNEYLTVQYALCHEGIEGVQWVKVDGIDYNDNSKKFKHIIRTHKLGGVADAIATANNIDSNNRFTNTAYASATFKLNRDDYNYNGIPQMEFLVKGRKVKWVKELNGVYSLSTTSIYSNNPALCLLDYLMNSRFGRGLSVNEIDLESFYKSAAVCDTVVATDRTVAGQVNNQLSVTEVADFGSLPSDLEEYVYEKLWKTLDTGKYWQWNRTQWVETVYNVTRPIPLYECNLTLDTESNIRDNIERIMNTMGLAELTWSSEGKYKLLLEHPKTATELSNLVDANHYFTDNDIIRDDASLSWPSASSRLNQATINFLNEHEDFKEDTITWPLSYSAVHTQYLTEDNNQPFQANIDADGITDPYHALAMAEQAVRKARSIFTLNFTVSKKGLNLEPGDFIKVNSDNLNILNEIFRVESIEVRGDFTVGLTCYKFDHEALAWNVEDDIAYTTQPVFDFSVGAPTNGVFTQGAEDNLGTSSGRLSWEEADDIAVIDYLVEVSRDNKVTYQTLGVTRSTTFDVTGLKTGAYDFSIRGRTPLGGLSDRLEVDDETVLLKTVGKVAIIYANTGDELTNTQSYTPGANPFVAYYAYTSDLPTLPIRTGISFSSFVGEDGYTPVKGVDYFDGADGADGATGTRGAGWWRYETGSSASTAGLSSSTVTTYFTTATGLTPVNGDKFVLTNTLNQANAYVYTTSWAIQSAFVDGDLLVNGTITADKLTVDKLSAISADLGDVTISNTLRLATGSAGFIGGRTSASAYNENGFFVARTDKGGGLAGFEVSHTSTANNELSGIIHLDNSPMKVFNPEFYLGGDILGGSATTISDVNLGKTSEVIMTIVGGGGGGGSGRDDGYGGGTGGASGGSTVVRVRAGSITGTILGTYTALGGNGGANANYGNGTGEAGKSTVFGAGGAGGPRNTAGSNAPSLSYGAGGGGGGGDASSLFDASGGAGFGGLAGQTIEVDLDTSAYSTQDIWLEIDVGAGGNGSTEYNYYGGQGRNGAVTYSSPLGGTTRLVLTDLQQKYIPTKTWSGTYNCTLGPTTKNSGLITLPAGWYRTTLTISLTLPRATSDDSYVTSYEMRHVSNGLETVLKSATVGIGDNGPYTFIYTLTDSLFYFGGSDRFRIYQPDVTSNQLSTVNSLYSITLEAEGPFDGAVYA